ncbi:hypothetical protein [Streptomyces sp. WAC06614]|uniref:hypothetical protein n=1 Tax=Streptomyces sp. WAC06614 TaxID=2487416 RepID=UPI000F779E0B|nr:hypothetical protein [Streptomyces sp. WAC06614]RSS74776.1 hypothetical protein EF918_24440 [Streptomyces sp. WAC06614]
MTPRTSPPLGRRAAPAAVVLAAALLGGGCATDGHGAAAGAHAPTSAAPTARPAPLQAIETAIGCTASVTVDAEELRQGGCETPAGAFRMVTFAAPEGERQWLAEARAYGGTYLVGDRWIVTATPDSALTGLHHQLGGTLESGDSHDAGHDAGDDAGNGAGHGTGHDAGHHAGHP